MLEQIEPTEQTLMSQKIHVQNYITYTLKLGLKTKFSYLLPNSVYNIIFIVLHHKGALWLAYGLQVRTLIGLWIAQSLSQSEPSLVMEINENNVIYRIRQQIWNVGFLNGLWHFV